VGPRSGNDLPFDVIRINPNVAQIFGCRSFQSGIFRGAQGIKTKSANLALGSVRHSLNFATSEWVDVSNLTRLQSAPKIRLVPVTDARKPYRLSWDMQTRFINKLPSHLAKMVPFKHQYGMPGDRRYVVLSGIALTQTVP